jgi:exonuclease VII small subunit
MDAVPEANQHEDVSVHTAHQLNAAMERVRQARQLLHEASDRLTLTRQEVEQDERIERVRRAREHLDAANQQLAQTRQQAEEDQHPNAVGPTTDD